MRLAPGPQVGDINVAILVAGDRNDAQARHHRAGRIGAVRGSRDKANPATRFTPVLVKFADDEEPGVFALRTGVGLKGDGGETGDFRQPFFQLPEQ